MVSVSDLLLFSMKIGVSPMLSDKPGPGVLLGWNALSEAKALGVHKALGGFLRDNSMGGRTQHFGEIYGWKLEDEAFKIWFRFGVFS